MTQTVNAPTVGSEPELELLRRLEDGSLREIEVAWSDPFGHAQGKRIPATAFLDRARGSGFAFCEASLGWNSDATVIDSLRLTNWDGGYPDVFAVPDLSTFRVLAWRPGVGHVVSDIVSDTTAARRYWTHGRYCEGCSITLRHWASPRKSVSNSNSICSNPTGRRSRTTSTRTRWRTPTRWIRCSPTCTRP
jgi:hypothetical protein